MNGRDVDDPAASALRDDLLCDALAAQERAGQVDRDDLIPFGLRCFQKWILTLDAGVVHQNVDPAEGLDGVLDQHFNLVRVADVGRDRGRAAVDRLQRMDEVFRLVARADVVDDDTCSLARHLGGDRPPDSGRRAGDDSDFVLESH